MSYGSARRLWSGASMSAEAEFLHIEHVRSLFGDPKSFLPADASRIIGQEVG